MPTNTAFLALGSNLGEPKQFLANARTALHTHPHITLLKASSIHTTKPWGYPHQNDFLNQALKIQTTLNPHELLQYCQTVEEKNHRTRTIKNGPRTLDIDILTFNNQTIHSPTLTLPHPRMNERPFVLEPLKEIL